MSLTPLSAEESAADARYQDMVASYYCAQANFQKAQRECTRLHQVVRAKQEVIEELLPYYPHPLSHSLQVKIRLT